MSATSPGNRYGRQGGGWTDHDGTYAKDALATIAKLRAAGLAAGTWPKLPEGAASFRRPNDGDEGYTWDGAARMARARQAAGLPLTPIDVEALDRCP